MAHSYIEFRGRGLFLNDMDIIVIAELLMKSAQNHGEIPDDVQEMFDWWNETLAAGAGTIDLALDENLKGADAKLFICAALDSVSESLRSFGPVLSAGQLNAITKEKIEFVGDRKTADFETIANRLRELLQCEAI